MISVKMQDAMNRQINREFYSSYLYLSMASYCEDAGMPGFANWMNVQVREEKDHAMKLFRYVNERGGRVVLQPIEAPQIEWENVQVVANDVYSHEQKVTAMINNLVDLAMEEKDHASFNFLQWYVAEQVEEEASVSEVVSKLKLIGKDGNGLFALDKEMGQRIYHPPVKED